MWEQWASKGLKYWNIIRPGKYSSTACLPVLMCVYWCPVEMDKHQFHGFATMYMRMPMSSSSLPIQGSCTVEERRVTLRFPFTGIEFDLPSVPSAQSVASDFDFLIRSEKGRDMTVTVSRLEELDAYVGYGREEGEEHAVLTFVFYALDSPLSRLPRI